MGAFEESWDLGFIEGQRHYLYTHLQVHHHHPRWRSLAARFYMCHLPSHLPVPTLHSFHWYPRLRRSHNVRSFEPSLVHPPFRNHHSTWHTITIVSRVRSSVMKNLLGLGHTNLPSAHFSRSLWSGTTATTL
jgi:hypothetical protein